MRKQEYISTSKDSGTSDGTTTSSYANALDWKCDLLTRKNITLKNTHATNDLKYQVLTYAFVDGLSYTEVSETTLAARAVGPGNAQRGKLPALRQAADPRSENAAAGRAASRSDHPASRRRDQRLDRHVHAVASIGLQVIHAVAVLTGPGTT